ncbi:MAG: flagellar assembly protein FliW [Armatimonadetes bacterium]|nr:flagellar assembly protein FliW [Armatimonadota bacterium]
MKVETSRFGEIQVNESSVIKMHRGPIGFEDHTSFVVVEHRPDTEFRWFQSTQEATLAFVVVDPSKFFNEYEITISDADAEKLNLKDEADANAFVIVTIPGSGQEITANLAAPLIINTKEMTAMQVILPDSQYPVRHPLVAVNETFGQETEKITVKAA